MELDIVSLETFNIKHRFLLLQIFLLPKNVEIYVWVQVFPLEDCFKLIYQRFINAQQNVAIIQHKIRQKRIIHTLLDKKKLPHHNQIIIWWCPIIKKCDEGNVLFLYFFIYFHSAHSIQSERRLVLFVFEAREFSIPDDPVIKLH